MTYRWDSNFVRPYGWIEPRNIQESQAPTAANPYNLSYPQGNGKILSMSFLTLSTLTENPSSMTLSALLMAQWLFSQCYENLPCKPRNFAIFTENQNFIHFFQLH
jgi:hypothetical protein